LAISYQLSAISFQLSAFSCQLSVKPSSLLKKILDSLASGLAAAALKRCATQDLAARATWAVAGFLCCFVFPA
jgi:hypothetical protein